MVGQCISKWGIQESFYSPSCTEEMPLSPLHLIYSSWPTQSTREPSYLSIEVNAVQKALCLSDGQPFYNTLITFLCCHFGKEVATLRSISGDQDVGPGSWPVCQQGMSHEGHVGKDNGLHFLFCFFWFRWLISYHVPQNKKSYSEVNLYIRNRNF